MFDDWLHSNKCLSENRVQSKPFKMNYEAEKFYLSMHNPKVSDEISVFLLSMKKLNKKAVNIY